VQPVLPKALQNFMSPKRPKYFLGCHRGKIWPYTQHLLINEVLDQNILPNKVDKMEVNQCKHYFLYNLKKMLGTLPWW
jgi:hypothetical protein